MKYMFFATFLMMHFFRQKMKLAHPVRFFYNYVNGLAFSISFEQNSKKVSELQESLKKLYAGCAMSNKVGVEHQAGPTFWANSLLLLAGQPTPPPNITPLSNEGRYDRGVEHLSNSKFSDRKNKKRQRHEVLPLELANDWFKPRCH